MSTPPTPFLALGLPERPDPTDEQVRAAWRKIAAATHPDRPDGGDLARYTAASAAHGEVRSPWRLSQGRARHSPRPARRRGPRPVPRRLGRLRRAPQPVGPVGGVRRPGRTGG